MVLDYFFQPKTILQKPLILGIMSFLYTIIGATFGYFLFPHAVGFGMLLFVILAFVPFMYHILQEEEVYIESHTQTRSIFLHTEKVLARIILLFIGITIGFIFIQLVLPSQVGLALFEEQRQLTSHITGMMTAEEAFSHILINNLIVLLLAFTLGFVYALGAITVIVWNASILGFVFASLLASQSVLTTFLRFVFHTIPEIAGFALAGIAGTVLSFGIIRHHKKGDVLKHILKSVVLLFLCAVILVILAALIEVSLSPLFY